MASPKTVRVMVEGNIPLSILANAGAPISDYALNHHGGARVERGTEIVVDAEVYEKIKNMKILGSKPGYFNKHIDAFRKLG